MTDHPLMTGAPGGARWKISIFSVNTIYFYLAEIFVEIVFLFFYSHDVE